MIQTWMYNSPKIIHLIWFGSPFGSQRMPQEDREDISYKDNLLRIVKNNPKYQVYLWTDSASANLMQDDQFSGLTNLHIVNLDVDSDEKEKLSSIKSSEQLFKKIDIFRDKDKTGKNNYAAASDILKALVLYEFGGIYLDADTFFSKSFPESFKLPNKICLGGGSEKDSSTYGIPILSNDVIAVQQKEVPELNSYLQLINKYMNDSTIGGMLKLEDLDLISKGQSYLRDEVKGPTVRFGPQLMRFCVMGAELTDNADLDNYIKSFRKESDDNIQVTFDRVMNRFNNETLKKAENVSEVCQKHLFPTGYLQRGQANDWLRSKINIQSRSENATERKRKRVPSDTESSGPELELNSSPKIKPASSVSSPEWSTSSGFISESEDEETREPEENSM